MKIVPHQHRILVQVDEVEEKSSGGIIMSSKTVDAEQQAQVMATILEVGPTAEVDRELIKPGIRVVIAKWGGMTPPGYESDHLKLIDDSDICGVEVADDE